MIQKLQSAVKTAGGTKQEIYVLAGISYVLTDGDPAWVSASGDGRGAWGISQKWYPGTPSDLPGQAKQALTVFRNRGLSGTADNLALAALAWWYPSGDAPASVKASIELKAADYARKAKPGVSRAGMGLVWVLVAAVVIGLLWRK